MNARLLVCNRGGAYSRNQRTAGASANRCALPEVSRERSQVSEMPWERAAAACREVERLA